jgi:hypothetical protein
VCIHFPGWLLAAKSSEEDLATCFGDSPSVRERFEYAHGAWPLDIIGLAMCAAAGYNAR